LSFSGQEGKGTLNPKRKSLEHFRFSDFASSSSSSDSFCSSEFHFSSSFERGMSVPEPEYAISHADYERCSSRHEDIKQPPKVLSAREQLATDLSKLTRTFSTEADSKHADQVWSLLDDVRSVFKIVLRPPSADVELAAGALFEPRHAVECVLPTAIRADVDLIASLLDELESRMCVLLRHLFTVVYGEDAAGTRTLNIFDDKILWRTGAPQKKSFLPVLDISKWTTIPLRTQDRVPSFSEHLHSAVDAYVRRIVQPAQFFLYELVVKRCLLSICPNRYLLATNVAISNVVASRIDSICEEAMKRRREEIEAAVVQITLDDPATRALPRKERLVRWKAKVSSTRTELQSLVEKEEKLLRAVRGACRVHISAYRTRELEKYESGMTKLTLNCEDTIRIQKSDAVCRRMFTLSVNVNMDSSKEPLAATKSLIEARVRWFVRMLQSDPAISDMCNSFFEWNASQDRCFISEMAVHLKPETLHPLAILKAFVHVFTSFVYPLYTSWSGHVSNVLVRRPPKKKKSGTTIISSVNKASLMNCMAMGARPDQGVHLEKDPMIVKALAKLEFELWCAVMHVSDCERDTFVQNFEALVLKHSDTLTHSDLGVDQDVKTYCREFAKWCRDKLCLDETGACGKLFQQFVVNCIEKQLLDSPHGLRRCVSGCTVDHTPESNRVFAERDYKTRMAATARTHSDPLVPGTLISFWLGRSVLRTCKQFQLKFPAFFPAEEKKQPESSPTAVRKVRILSVVHLGPAPSAKRKREADEASSDSRPVHRGAFSS
jgi:hypothetical protein